MQKTGITKSHQYTVAITGPQVGFTLEEVSARSMHAVKAITILIARFDTDTIRLVGRWRSDAMICYLHTSAQGFTLGITARMVRHGDYALIPHSHGG